MKSSPFPRRALLGLLGVLGGFGCAPKDSATPTITTLSSGEAAIVGAEVVTLGEVKAVAVEQHLSVEAARDVLIEDALWAAGAAEEPKLAAHRLVVTRAALVRALVDDIEQQVKAEGPPNDTEVAEFTAERWSILDRPPTVRVTHAVAQVKKDGDWAAAQKVAEQITEAVRGVTDSKEFIRLAEALPKSGIDIRAERLPPMTEDGRSPAPKSRPDAPTAGFDPLFAQAAHRIAEVGQQSPLVKTPFGYHVILLEKRGAEIRVPLEERRAQLAELITARRGRKVLDALLVQLRNAQPIEFERAADSLTARAAAQ